jgi:MICOS complex subunit MIC19
MELERLRKEDDVVRREIEQALDKENLYKEKSPSDGTLGSTKNSAALFGDLDELRHRLRDVAARPDSAAFSAAKEDGEALVSCYRYVGYSSVYRTLILTDANCQSERVNIFELLA